MSLLQFLQRKQNEFFFLWLRNIVRQGWTLSGSILSVPLVPDINLTASAVREKNDLSRTFLFLTFCTKDHFDLPHYTYERLNDARMKEKILTEARVRINQDGRKMEKIKPRKSV